MTKRTWFTAAVKADDPAAADIAIYDEIGFWGVTSADFRDALASLGDVKKIDLRINSPGGEVFDGIAIYNMLRRHPAEIAVTVDGIAASMASLVAMAGDTVAMPENAMMMVHNPAGGVIGTAADMRDWADALDKISQGMVATYVGKTGLAEDEIKALLDAETWLTAAEAKDKGFADAVLPARQMQARFDPERFPNAPAAARALAKKPRARQAPRAAAEDWSVGAARDLPIDDAASWDGPAAAERMLDAAGFNGENPDSAAARRGFLVYDAGNPGLKGSYKLPFADVVDGNLTAIGEGIRAAASRLPQTDIPQDVADSARAVIDAYEARIQEMMQQGNARASDADTAGKAERERCLAIAELCRLAGRPALAGDWIATGKSVGEVRAALLELRAQAETKDEISARHSGGAGEAPAALWGRVRARRYGNGGDAA